ncbi:transcription/translation regulatory transformer protein RfaH [Thalassomonas sp. M1454]|uniref:transcription/translation regulatory transformer protein RfaH n=1 Tax=Thalassomonas sp. M1454 TaxID=2594477 RepID=UPI00117F2CC7|nr:transcription/translation regulatory transformer protein RfaH [Thalassomonas sp. M1454]TRX57203.1 transcription/translation regulatory transformer protein RfaH [Thalassomonas sp. M1454]
MLNAQEYQSSQHWYVLTSKPREEQRAFDNLTSQGHDVFLPKIAKVKKRQGIKVVSLEPLFPNYLFIRLDKEQANFNAVRSTRGVGAFVRFGATQATISEQLIEKIKQDTQGEAESKTLDDLIKFNSGEKVEITEGPFKGLEAIYKSKDGLERSILMVKMLGQENEIKIENQVIEKVS